MRLVQFILIFVLLGNYSVKAQRTDFSGSKNTQRTVLSGSKVAISMSSFSGEHASDYLVSELFGIFVNIPISDKFSVQTEFDLGYIGWANPIDATPASDTMKIPILRSLLD